MYAKRALILLAMLLCLACWSARPAHAADGLPADDIDGKTAEMLVRAPAPPVPASSWAVGALAIAFIVVRRSLTH